MSDSQPALIEFQPRLPAGLPDDYDPSRFHAGEELTAGRVLIHLGLFLITVCTTTIAGGLFPLMFSEQFSLDQAISNPAIFGRILASGMLFSFTLLTILGTHELGHYFACRYYGVRATLPYFIPVPLGVGTFGAFIRIKSPITSRKALFDIGIAGPLAGFLFALPASLIGLLSATPAAAVVQRDGTFIFHDPLLFQLISRFFHLPAYTEWNPIWFAAWVGMLATGLNLLPVGQLDGGHVIYSLFGKRGHRFIAWLFYAAMIGVTVYGAFFRGWYGGLLYLGMLTVMLFFKHPPTLAEESSIGLARKVVGAIGLIVFLLSFIPLPVTAG